MIDALGFKATLLERNIPSNCAIIQIDNEKDTKKAIESEFKNVTEVDSKNCTGVRICDIVAGFVCNMLKAITRALNPNESALDDEKANAQWYNILIIKVVPTTQTNPIMKGAIPCPPSKTASSASTWTKRKFSGPTENATPSFLYRCLLRSTP